MAGSSNAEIKATKEYLTTKLAVKIWLVASISGEKDTLLSG